MKKKISLVLSIILAFTFLAFTHPTSARAEDKDVVVGAKNLNDTTENSAKVGDQLLQPEKEWKRYDDTDSRILYNEGKTIVHNQFYQGSEREWIQSVKFRMVSDRLLLLGYVFSNYSDDIEVKIDNEVVEHFSAIGNNRNQVVLFKKDGLEFKEHYVEITNKKFNIRTETTPWIFVLDAIDISEKGSLKPYVDSITLDKSSINLLTGKTDKLTATVKPDNATNKEFEWSSSDEKIATIDKDGNIKAIEKGTATITAKFKGTDLKATCEVSVTEPSDESVTVESEIDRLSINKEFTTDIVLHAGKNICAEDIKISYNKDLFEYVGYEQIDGLRVNKEIKNIDAGNLRFIVSSLGKKNAINGDKSMIKLKFKAKAIGKGKVDVTQTRIADNGSIERDIAEDKCGEKEFTIVSDVNRDGEFSLLDLGIDSWYHGSDVKDTDTTKFDADVVVNGKIDDQDLDEITNQLIANPNYQPNK
ncbi:Uncharacterized conserved protein YjdB, contains Ig-like domain [Clostridium cavendishii DSM 21758]|uniref:Uncharacterized conserved protein YjdB, contains Ig-like domain n=1 Tax=Clostridium cavendishii DSM 21758 TaxID=1121302 RepID=A0A1M6STZ4_9CLOT|nr:Ig-like domain-containing protein [Clostridium cavendishii]SHK48038.1 Uncharacterized conserved protein YjdB, contains Ig-like domain [Clostridium cavendishii DSM 21758]